MQTISAVRQDPKGKNKGGPIFVTVKYWFIKKAFEGLQKEFAMLYEPKIIKQSAKGVLLEWDIPERGSFRTWAPIAAVEQ